MVYWDHRCLFHAAPHSCWPSYFPQIVSRLLSCLFVYLQFLYRWSQLLRAPDASSHAVSRGQRFMASPHPLAFTVFPTSWRRAFILYLFMKQIYRIILNTFENLVKLCYVLSICIFNGDLLAIFLFWLVYYYVIIMTGILSVLMVTLSLEYLGSGGKWLVSYGGVGLSTLLQNTKGRRCLSIN